MSTTLGDLPPVLLYENILNMNLADMVRLASTNSTFKKEFERLLHNPYFLCFNIAKALKKHWAFTHITERKIYELLIHSYFNENNCTYTYEEYLRHSFSRNECKKGFNDINKKCFEIVFEIPFKLRSGYLRIWEKDYYGGPSTLEEHGFGISENGIVMKLLLQLIKIYNDQSLADMTILIGH